MKEKFYNIVKANKKVCGVVIDYSPMLWAIVQACSGKPVSKVERIILAQLSPASEFLCPIENLDYPRDFGSDELLRAEKPLELKEAVRERGSIQLSELLELRIGTPATYSIVLAVALTANGYPCEIAITGPDADPANYTFAVYDGQPIDLYGDGLGASQRRLRPHKEIKL